MEIAAFVSLLGNVAVIVFAVICVVAVGMVVFDRAPVRENTVQSDLEVKDEDRRAA